jgi:hypothetical protein
MTASGKNQSSSRRQGGRRRKTSRKKSIKPQDFWGEVDQLPSSDTHVRITPDPAAVVRSLGRPPLSGQYNVAEHYFTAVYDRAVTLASALAAAGDLLETDGDAEAH